jgi:hypothetical protein
LHTYHKRNKRLEYNITFTFFVFPFPGIYELLKTECENQQKSAAMTLVVLLKWKEEDKKKVWQKTEFEKNLVKSQQQKQNKKWKDLREARRLPRWIYQHFLGVRAPALPPGVRGVIITQIIVVTVATPLSYQIVTAAQIVYNMELACR